MVDTKNMSDESRCVARDVAVFDADSYLKDDEAFLLGLIMHELNPVTYKATGLFYD